MKHKHHIIPKHAGGSDDPENIIELTIEEHAEAHRILYETYGRYQDYLAWQGLAGLMSREEIVEFQLREAGKKGGSAGKGISGKRKNGAIANWKKNKEHLSEVLKQNGKKYGHLGGVKRKGSIWINDGVEAKTISNIEEIPDGWKLGRLAVSDEVKEKISKSCSGINRGPKSDEHKKKLSLYRKGRKWYHNKETLESRMFSESENIPSDWIAGRGKKLK